MRQMNPALIQEKNVVIITNPGKASRRDCLSGIFRFVREHGRWNIQIVQSVEGTAQTEPSALDPSRVDGVITTETRASEMRKLLGGHGMPLVVVGSRENETGKTDSRIAFVRIDDAEIGRFGAERLGSFGQFASCAFLLPPDEPEWAVLRAKSFSREFQRGKRCRFFMRSGTGDLDVWLRGLPKPAAVMAANDFLAFAILEAARAARIPVPQSLAVIGVDNDSFLCDMAKPPLTSILPDHEEVGFAAATELQRLMSGRRSVKPRTTLCRGHRFVERESARFLAPAARVIREALHFIDSEFAHGITPDDVAGKLGISRRLLDLRFHEFSGLTVSETIRERQLARTKELLTSTKMPIRQITASCGFPNETYPKDLFRKRFGMSMREWRTSHAAR